MALITKAQAVSMMTVGFDRGVAGYPILFSNSGRVTIVEEGDFGINVWEFEPDGSSSLRKYRRSGIDD